MRSAPSPDRGVAPASCANATADPSPSAEEPSAGAPPTDSPPAETPSAESVHAELEALGPDGVVDDALLERCLAARSDARGRFMTWLRIGQRLLVAERWAAAEEMAVRSLKALPRYGAAFRLMAEALAGRGETHDADLCHRYVLPESMREKHFADTPVRWSELPPARARDAAPGDEGRPGGATGHAADTSEDDVEVLPGHPAECHAIAASWQLRPRAVAELSATTLKSAPSFTARLPNGRLWFDTFNTIVWNGRGEAVRGLCRGYAEVVQGVLAEHPPLALAGRVCLLGNRNARNYYHWMNDVIPRLAVLRESGIALESIDHFVLDGLDHPFHRETLARFGIGEDRLHLTTATLAEHVAADELLVPVYGSNSLGMAQGAWNPRFLAEAFAPPGPPGPPGPLGGGARLYVGRGTSGARGIVNEPELIERLERHGFESVRCETLTVAEQAARFAAAEVVVGPHGAGFTNLAFCRPGTRVVELFDAHMEPCFRATCALASLWHAVHHCGPATSSAGDDAEYHRSHDTRRDAPISVDLDQIEALLRALGMARSAPGKGA